MHIDILRIRMDKAAVVHVRFVFFLETKESHTIKFAISIQETKLRESYSSLYVSDIAILVIYFFFFSLLSLYV